MLYAEIIIDISAEKLDRTFSYLVPEHLAEEIRIGMVVTVPFGASNREIDGYVVALSEECGLTASSVKEIKSLKSSEETTEAKLIGLAAWMKQQYGSTMIQALKTVLPMRERKPDRIQKRIVLDVSPEEAQEWIRKMRAGRMQARARVLEALCTSPDGTLSMTAAARDFGASAQTVAWLQKQGIVHTEQSTLLRDPVTVSVDRKEKPDLNPMQRAAVEKILKEWEKESPRPVLIHGVTGSGKTEVYMELLEQVLAEGKQAIVLIPEIALTYQTVKRFLSRFGSRVSVLNSRMSPSERYDQFRRAKMRLVSIMIGPRSALFTPFPELGLVIIDEEHEHAYKSETTPRYHARETAVERCRRENARIVLGSATPSLEAYHRAREGEYALVKLDGRFGMKPLPQTEIIDLREELKSGNRSVFSRRLKEEIRRTLDRKKQVMLFLNRRGYAAFFTCRSCGHVIKCPHCDVSLSQHKNGKLICHYCGYERSTPVACPECGSPFIGGFKAGTEQIEQQLHGLFAEARILRMDFDTTRTKGSYEEILSAFSRHDADILLGTQMIVKGHDFPDVTLVGILAADLSLNESDFRSAEYTYQLLTQAAGRAGRGSEPGLALIQTYHPEHYSVRFAADADYERFFEEEMGYRSLAGYPPAVSMLAVHASGEDEAYLDTAMRYLAAYVRKIAPGDRLKIIGPAPDSIRKVRDMYRQVLRLRHTDTAYLIRIRRSVEKYVEINSGFQKIYIQYELS